MTAAFAHQRDSRQTAVSYTHLDVYKRQIISYTIIKNTKYKGMASEIISLLLMIVTGVIFILFTFSPPLIPMFEDAVTKTYGI